MPPRMSFEMFRPDLPSRVYSILLSLSDDLDAMFDRGVRIGRPSSSGTVRSMKAQECMKSMDLPSILQGLLQPFILRSTLKNPPPKKC